MLASGVGDMGNPGDRFEDDERTVMMPTFADGSFFADRYRVERLLGSGAMGRVYAATELHSQRRVAIKVLHKERLGEEETVERFKREAEVLASTGHPCIVDIYAFHHTPDGTPYLAMELLEGVTLKTRLQNAGRFEDPVDFQPILDGICGALDAAHARGIVHRDMKPDNIFLPATGEPRAKLVDFGLSRIAKPDKSLTHSGMILGTPRYMAPEQIREASSAGPAGDIYSLAIIVFESLAGQSPYPAQDYGQLLGCVLESRTNALVDARPDLPPAVSDVVRRAMMADASERFQTCTAFAAAFGHAIGSPSQVEQIGRNVPAPEKRKRVPSLSAIPMNKGSTLAFDVAAFGGDLPDIVEPPPAAPPGAPGPWSDEVTARDVPEEAAPSASGERIAPGPSSTQRSPGAAPHGAASSPWTPQPVGSQPGVVLSPTPAPHAQGGDTLYLGDVGGAAGPPPPSPAPIPHSYRPPAPPGPAHRPPQPSYAPAAAPAPKKSRLGLVLFGLALVVVVVLSAAGGLALRAHMRGELSLPFAIPGVTPASTR